MLEVNFQTVALFGSEPAEQTTRAGQEAELQETHSCTAGGEPVWWLCFVKLVFSHFTVSFCQECTAAGDLLSFSLLPFQRNKLFMGAEVFSVC